MIFTQNKICCISDIHVGVHQNSAMWLDITVSWAKWLRAELRKKRITDIMISGDLFHYRDEISVNTIQVVTEILTLWKEFNIVMLVGNHDSYYKDRIDVNSLSILAGWDNITVYSKPEQIEHGSKKIMFCPWGTRPEEMKPSDIIFGHFEIRSFKMNQHKVCTDGISSKELLKYAPLIITGHFHLRELRQYKDGEILYLGNPYQMDFGDVESSKGYYILDIHSSSYKFYENKISPKHKKIRLSELVKHSGITPDVEQMFRNNIVKFIIDRHIAPDEIDLLLSKFSDLKPVSINTDYEINFNTFGLEETNDVDISGVDIPQAIQEFVNMLNIKNKDDVVKITLDLYNKSK